MNNANRSIVFLTMNESFYTTLEEQLQSERTEIAASANSWEGREGLAAFVDKRRPVYVTADVASPTDSSRDRHDYAGSYARPNVSRLGRRAGWKRTAIAKVGKL